MSRSISGIRSFALVAAMLCCATACRQSAPEDAPETEATAGAEAAGDEPVDEEGSAIEAEAEAEAASAEAGAEAEAAPDAEPAPPVADAPGAFVDVPSLPLAIPQLEGFAYYEALPGFVGPGSLAIRVGVLPGAPPIGDDAALAEHTAFLVDALGASDEPAVSVVTAPQPGVRAMVSGTTVDNAGQPAGAVYMVLDEVTVGLIVENIDDADPAEVEALLRVLEQSRPRPFEPSANVDGTMSLLMDAPADWFGARTPAGAVWAADEGTGIPSMGLGVMPGVRIEQDALSEQVQTVFREDIPLEGATYEEIHCGESHGLPWCAQVGAGALNGEAVRMLLVVGLRGEEAWSFGGIATADGWATAEPVFESAVASIRRR